MKKIMFLLILVMLLPLFGCAGEETDHIEIKYSEGIFEDRFSHYKDPEVFSRFFEEGFTRIGIGFYRKDVVPNKEVAAEIGNAIMKGMIELNPHFLIEGATMDLVDVFYDIEKEIWVLGYVPHKPGYAIFGMGWNIALRKSDGKVLKIWTEE